jgi:hypothetical protein
MSKLTDFYAHKAALIEKNLPVDAQQDHGDGKITGTIDHSKCQTLAKGLSPSADTFTLESEIASLVYQLYGFTEEELDFTIRSALPLASSKNYDIKYRMGDELSD